jgi:hypothetical protein
MSLQLAAKHLSTKGRGPDDTLVHMSRGEVKSLNDLAMAHGGQLTINPQTGLPEAGFLSMLLPVIAGAALGPAGVGMSAGMAGLAGGALSYALNPKAGLMGALSAGMGAYGGAGLGEALAAQGMEQATAASLANKPEYLAQQEAIKNATANQLSSAPGAALTPEAYADQMRGLGTSATNTYNTALANAKPTDFMGKVDMMGQGIKSTFTDPNGFSNLTDKLGGGMGTARTALSIAAPAIVQQPKDESVAPVVDKDMGQRYSYSAGAAQPLPTPDVPSYDAMLTQQDNFGKEQNYYPTRGYTKVSKDEAKNIYGFADGGPVERMSNNAAMGANTMYPMANMATSSFATPYQTPQSTNMLANMVAPSGGGAVNAMSGEPSMQGTRMAEGGISDAQYNLGGYSDGGRLLRGPGDGVSDSIPAMIGKKQPARLADGEFVVPARIVSEIGNGSTEAGARKLYAMMDRVQSARRQTVGRGKVAKNSRADKYLPA